MSGDHKFYYDFGSETKLENWDVVRLEQHCAVLQCNITMEEGNYLFLAPCLADDERSLPHLKQLAVNGETLPIEKSKAVYVHSSFARYGVECRMKPGNNLFTAEISLPQEREYAPSHLFFSLQKAEEPPDRFVKQGVQRLP